MNATLGPTNSNQMPITSKAGKFDFLQISGRIPALDGLRGLAILLVLWGHFTIITTQTPLDKVYVYFAGLGWTGVDLFFVLSGFLITGLLIDSKHSSSYFQNFYARRVLRIFPLYYLVVFISLIILPHIAHAKIANFSRIKGDEWYYWLHLSNWSIARVGGYRHGILDVSWSLSIEEQFYLIWPAIVWFCSPKRLIQVCVAMIAIALISRASLIWGYGFDGTKPFGNFIAPYVLTPCRLDSLGWGALVAIAVRRPFGAVGLLPLARMLWAPLLCAALAITVVEKIIQDYPVGYPPGMGPWAQTLFYSFSAPAFASVLLLCAYSRPGTRLNSFMCSGFMRACGKYSYAVYLFHMPLRAFVRDIVFSSENFSGYWKFPQLYGSELPGQMIFYVVSGALAFSVAWLSWRIYEQPILSLKRFFPAPHINPLDPVGAQTDRREDSEPVK